MNEKVLVILTKTWGSTPQKAGAKMLVWADGFSGTLGGGRLELEALNTARELLREPASETVTLVKEFILSQELEQCCGGKVQIYFEKQMAKTKLLVFGAGHVGREISSVLSGTNIEAHFIDERPEWLKFLAPDSVAHNQDALKFIVALPPGFASMALVLTHSHDLDENIVEALVQRADIQNVGLIGSGTKWRRFHARLLAKGLTEAQLTKVQCPVGVLKGSPHPREIAISISAQVFIWNEKNQSKIKTYESSGHHPERGLS